MILVTLGTHEDPFDRVVAVAPALLELDDEVVLQAGCSTLPAPGCRRLDLVPYTEFVALAEAADVIVCHAGVGSILTALGAGRRPVVVPRRADLGEHVDDHQMELAVRLAEEGFVTLVEDERDLVAAVRAASPRLAEEDARVPDLAVELGGYLDAVAGRPRGLRARLGARRRARSGAAPAGVRR